MGDGLGLSHGAAPCKRDTDGLSRIPSHFVTQGAGGLAQDPGHRTEGMAVG